jgi:hypothetical protein
MGVAATVQAFMTVAPMLNCDVDDAKLPEIVTVAKSL